MNSEPDAAELHNNKKDLGESPPAGRNGLAIMDEIYEAGELLDASSDDSVDEAADFAGELGDVLDSGRGDVLLDADEEEDEEEDDDADVIDPAMDRLFEELMESYNLDDNVDGRPRVEVDKEFASEVVSFLINEGTLLFLARYVLPQNSEYTPAELIAALGFRLPIDVVESPDYSRSQFEMLLQVAIRWTLTHRKRLPRPRTLSDVAETIEKAQNIMVVTGAGISTSLGIPDFRSDNGLYAQLEHLGLADPQEVFDIRTFHEDPAIFYSVAAKILPEEGLHSGTPTHAFIKLIQDKGKLMRNYTQNIDNLEHYIGLQPEKVVQCHGSFGSAHCVTCGYAVPKGEALFSEIRAGEIPRCPQCAVRAEKHKRQTSNSDDDDNDPFEAPSFGVIKPDITFFGEALPARFDHMLFDEGDAKNCDLLLCMGTSLRVSPVSEIVKVVPRDVPQIYVSKTAAKHLSFEVSFLGGCDDTVELLAQKLEWRLEHPMNKRPVDMSEDEYFGGRIQYSDGTFTFRDDIKEETAELAGKEKDFSSQEKSAGLSGDGHDEAAPDLDTETGSPVVDSASVESAIVKPETEASGNSEPPSVAVPVDAPANDSNE